MFDNRIDLKFKRYIIIIFVWLFVSIISFFLYYSYSIENIGFTPTQPVAFSHKIHSGKYGIKCLFCHTSAEFSNFSELPTTYSCIVCHSALKSNTDPMIPVNKSMDDTIPILWNRVYILPDYVHFSHSRHIRASIDCSSCHGKVDTMEVVFQVRKITMSWCLDCHRNPNKFVVKPTVISGIQDSKHNSMISDKSLPFTIPEYGMWYSLYLPKPKIIDLIEQKSPVRGSESCSSCHY